MFHYIQNVKGINLFVFLEKKERDKVTKKKGTDLFYCRQPNDKAKCL
jgi:hypothetical protein